MKSQAQSNYTGCQIIKKILLIARGTISQQARSKKRQVEKDHY